jgi:glycosyltransferase involved in cell wall biosynthesis
MKRKKYRLVFIAVFIWSILLYFVLRHWLFSFGLNDEVLSKLAFISATIWWIVLLWSIHHYTFQIVSIFKQRKSNKKNLNQKKDIPVAIIYPTSDDFQESSVQSCINQKYKNFKVYICDDSKEEKYIEIINTFYERNKNNCNLIRRQNRVGFKAGNLNNAIENYINEEWICLVDADQFLPEDFLSGIISSIPKDNPDVSYIQAMNEAREIENTSRFQSVLKYEILLYYSRDLEMREKYGFMPLLGHGALIKKDIFMKLGKFPEIVSEDFAFALKSASNKYNSIYASNVVSYESYPYDYGSFIIRLKKFGSGTAELIRKSAFEFIFSKAHIVEKWDFSLMILWYIMIPFIVLNGFISTYVTHIYWINEIPYIHPVLPYLYTYLLMSIFVILLSLKQSNTYSSMRFYFWSLAIYSASLPIVGLCFLKSLFIKPIFSRTPKSTELTRLKLFDTLFTLLIGITAVIMAVEFWSPFSWFLLGQGMAYLSFPFYPYLNNNNILGQIIRTIIILPGILMITALIALWYNIAS